MRRVGAKKKPMFRVVVTEARTAPDCAPLEVLGHYNPTSDPETIEVDRQRLRYWQDRGAQLSDTVRTLVVRHPEAAAAAAAAPVAEPAPLAESAPEPAAEVEPAAAAPAAAEEPPAAAETAADAEPAAEEAPAAEAAAATAPEPAADAEAPAGDESPPEPKAEDEAS